VYERADARANRPLSIPDAQEGDDIAGLAEPERQTGQGCRRGGTVEQDRDGDYGEPDGAAGVRMQEGAAIVLMTYRLMARPARPSRMCWSALVPSCCTRGAATPSSRERGAASRLRVCGGRHESG